MMLYSFKQPQNGANLGQKYAALTYQALPNYRSLQSVSSTQQTNGLCKCNRHVISFGKAINDENNPWAVTFDLRERETEWTDQNKVRLIKLIASNQLDIGTDEIEQRLLEISVMLPSLSSRLVRLQPQLLARIINLGPRIADQIVGLRSILKNINIDSVLEQCPELLVTDMKAIEIANEELHEIFKDYDTESLVQRCPRMLDIEVVKEVMDDLQRIMPNEDPAQLLFQDPGFLTRLEKGQKRLGANPDQIEDAYS